MSARLDGRRAFVTGASKGIGAAVARRLAAEGAHVVAAGRNAEDLDAVARDTGGDVAIFDIAEIGAAHAAVRDAGPLDILVNNAGTDDFDYFTNITPERWRRLLAVNLEGLFACTQAALPPMQEARYGRIVNVTSEAGRIGSSGNAVYAATKGAIISFTKSIARENARYAITANAVAPGPIETPMLDANRALPNGERIVEAMKAGTLLGRLGTSEEVAAAVAFIASDDASFITGETLGVSGGMGVGT